MKRLFLLRHAKSGDAGGPNDHERTLSDRGRRASELVSVYLAQRGDPPSLALCSTARRAQATLEPIRQRLGIPFASDPALYLAEPTAIVARLARLEDRDASVLVVGHNPGLHESALLLAGSGDGEARARLREGFPTAALAVLELDIEHWDEIRPGCGALVELRTPKDLV